MPRFTVAAIVHEPRAVLDRFVRWYLAQGAARIILYFDDPRDPALTAFAAQPQVEAIACTPDFWAGIGIAADARFTRRQNAALTHAYSELSAGWLLNVDADEVMYFKGMTIAKALAGLGPDTLALRVATAEQAICDAPGQIFRTQLPRATVSAVYGEDAELFRRRFGLIGHADGKSFHRAGQGDIRLRQHWAETRDGAEIQGLRLGAAEGAYLLHYFAPDYARWRSKIDWRLGAHGFPEPIKDRLRAIQTEADPEAGYLALYRKLHCLSPGQLESLRAHQGLLELPQDFAAG